VWLDVVTDRRAVKRCPEAVNSWYIQILVCTHTFVLLSYHKHFGIKSGCFKLSKSKQSKFSVGITIALGVNNTSIILMK